jgi:hypothetical protein
MPVKKRKILTVGLFFLSVALHSTTPVVAQVEIATESASQATPETTLTIEKKVATEIEVTNVVLDNLERLARNQERVQEVNTKYDGVTNKTRGFIAQVTYVKDDSLEIVTLSDEKHFIVPDKSTAIVKKGQPIAGGEYVLTETFAVDDWLVVIGIQSGTNFSPRRILISSESLAPKKHFVLRGSIKSATSSKLDILLSGTDTIESFTINKSSNLVNPDNETVAVKDLTPDANVLVIGSEKEGGSRLLETLRLL